jgi:prephenate dehydratase
MRISALGPHGSFSEIAALAYAKSISGACDVVLYPSIVDAFEAIGQDCEEGVVPIENMLDGHVSLSLDLLALSDLHIVRELIIPVRFSFVGNVKDLADVRRVYAQIVTQGQCRVLMKRFPRGVEIVTTESNSASYHEAAKGNAGDGAIVPAHMTGGSAAFGKVIDHVHDHPNNVTRFVALSGAQYPHDHSQLYKTSIVILDVADEPGALYKILGEIEHERLNLSSIISRPNKTHFGKYHFFMDIEAGYPENEKLKKVIDIIGVKNRIKVLGSYPQATV